MAVGREASGSLLAPSRNAHQILLCLFLVYLLFLLGSTLSVCRSQFISHISQRGLRGNITFNVGEQDAANNETLVVIEAMLEEADPARWLQGAADEDEFDNTQPILFEWSLHANTLEPQMLASCSNDDLGQPLGPSELQKLLTADKQIALGQANRWQVQLDELLRASRLSSAAKSLSALLWGKSVRLKLASVHGVSKSPPTATSPSSSPQDTDEPAARPALSAPVLRPSLTGAGAAGGGGPKPAFKHQPPRGSSSALSKPHLAAGVSPAPAPSHPSGKPTFAPRAKPTLSRPKAPTVVSVTQAPSLPKAEALVWQEPNTVVPPPETPPQAQNSTSSTTTTTTTTTTTQAPTRDMILEATHRRIARLYGRLVVCANVVDTRAVKTVEAVFESQIGGRVTMRGNEDQTTLLLLNLYHIRSKVTTRHDWLIMASDILDARREDEKCRYLAQVFDPNNLDPETSQKCSRTGPDAGKWCRMGDLTRKHGQVQVAGQGRRTRATLLDLQLPLSALENSRSLFLVIYEVTKSSTSGTPGPGPKPSILSCAPIKTVAARKLEASFNMDGVRGWVRLAQRHFSEPTTLTYDLYGLEGNTRHQSVRELPLSARTSPDNARLCSQLGPIFNPARVPAHYEGNSLTQLHTSNTVDAYPVGNLSAKHGPLAVIDSEYEDHYQGEHTDLNLQLFGLHSVAGRSLLLHKNNGEPWVCATLQYAPAQERPLQLAVATFHYPVVGQVSFSQLAGEPHAETTVLVELYNPNGEIKSADPAASPAPAVTPAGHNWLIHARPAGADFYNWSARCDSAGEVFDPVQSSVGLSADAYARQCQAGLAVGEPLRCRAGDTALKSGNLRLTLPLDPLDRRRHFYTDLYLPLAGPNSILGRSVVLYDESAPAQRGPRLACSNIRLVHPLRASVRAWDSGPSIPSAVRGLAAFEQDSRATSTRLKLELSGFNGNVEHYAIHQVWTTDDREFPCSNDSLYDIYDPTASTSGEQSTHSFAPSGPSATVDRLRVGDLSRKHGTLEGLQSVSRQFADANLPLFAPHSVVGRSVVLRAAVNDFRWVCGNIELDYDKASSRELTGLASFDDPRAKVAGYVRFTQLEHKDGSLSDTFVQVDLRAQSLVSDAPSSGLSGASSSLELRTSSDHNWAVFVNQVGEDAYIAADEVRCIAAGFKWNPYLAQDTRDAYPASTCTPREQLGCAMGDLGLRHGTLTLGPNNRRTLSDANLPLVGNYSVMGRSLVIFDNKRPNIKLACANIFPDIHLKSNVVIKRTPSFTVARFVEQMRSLLGASDWLLVPELRATKPVANGECVQMTIHFYGQRAHQMQVELNNLITLGTVRKSSRSGPEKISTHYKLCRAGQAQLTGATTADSPGRVSINLWLLLAVQFAGFVSVYKMSPRSECNRFGSWTP